MGKVSLYACPVLTPKKQLRDCTLFWFRVAILVLLFRPKSHKFHNLIISAFKKQLKFDFYFQHQAGKPLILFCNKQGLSIAGTMINSFLQQFCIFCTAAAIPSDCRTNSTPYLLFFAELYQIDLSSFSSLYLSYCTFLILAYNRNFCVLVDKWQNITCNI